MAGNAILEYFENVPLSEAIKSQVKQIISLKHSITKAVQRENAASWLEWSRSAQHLKTVSAEVPEGILPAGIHGTLYDVKVSSRGPDDLIYDRHKEIRDKVARGNCFLRLAGAVDPHERCRCVTFALKKFTGGLGDDDDREINDAFTWKKYFLQPLETAESVVCTRKANGEAAHLSATRIAGQKYICCGSKNVHMLVKSRDDIAKYTGDRYSIASEVCSTIFDVLESLDYEKSERLLEFLCETELTGVFEILNPAHQHVENFSHMTGPELKFIVWTTFNTLYTDRDELCCMPPHVAIETARALGLSTVDYDIIPVSQVDDRMKEIRRGYGYEGEVLYFMDGHESVIGLLKKKTIWYILCRAIREKLRGGLSKNQKNSATFSMKAYLRKINSRINDIQKWLGLDDVSTQKWKTLGCQCMEWAIHLQNQGKLDITNIGDKFPITWARFLTETEQSDRIDVVSEEVTEPLETEHTPNSDSS